MTSHLIVSRSRWCREARHQAQEKDKMMSGKEAQLLEHLTIAIEQAFANKTTGLLTSVFCTRLLDKEPYIFSCLVAKILSGEKFGNSEK